MLLAVVIGVIAFCVMAVQKKKRMVRPRMVQPTTHTNFTGTVPSILNVDMYFCIFNPHLPNELSHPYQLDDAIFHLRGLWCTFFIFIIFLIEIPVSKQCRRRVLIWVCTVCLCPKTWDATLIWVNSYTLFFVFVLQNS